MNAATRATVVLVSLAVAAWSGLVIGGMALEQPLAPVANPPIVLSNAAVDSIEAATSHPQHDFRVYVEAVKPAIAAAGTGAPVAAGAKTGAAVAKKSIKKKAKKHTSPSTKTKSTTTQRPRSSTTLPSYKKLLPKLQPFGTATGSKVKKHNNAHKHPHRR